MTFKTIATGRAFYYSRGDRWSALPEYETEFPSGERSRLSHPFSYQQDDEYQKEQFDFNADEIDLEALLSAFGEVIDESTNESNELPGEAIASFKLPVNSAATRSPATLT